MPTIDRSPPPPPRPPPAEDSIKDIGGLADAMHEAGVEAKEALVHRPSGGDSFTGTSGAQFRSTVLPEVRTKSPDPKPGEADAPKSNADYLKMLGLDDE